LDARRHGTFVVRVRAIDQAGAIGAASSEIVIPVR